MEAQPGGTIGLLFLQELTAAPQAIAIAATNAAERRPMIKRLGNAGNDRAAWQASRNSLARSSPDNREDDPLLYRPAPAVTP